METLENPTQEFIDKYGYPPTLAKACWDPWSYGVWLRDGRVIAFYEAKAVSRDWVTLKPLSGERLTKESACRDGLDVRVSEIIMVAGSFHKSG